jgi:hypothetical protein
VLDALSVIAGRDGTSPEKGGHDMNRSRLLVGIIFAALAVLSTSARADVPSASTSTTPAIIRLVESVAGVPDADAGRFSVVVRKLSGQTVAFADVVVDFSDCHDVVVCADQLDPNSTMLCSSKAVRKFTGPDGGVTFTIVGGSTGAGNASSIGGAARIYADGVLLRTPSAAAYDLDGQLGVAAGDLSTWLGDFASTQPWARSDYDGDGSVGGGDLSAWLTVFAGGRSIQSCGARCP